jgi:polyferredoxin
MTPTRRRVRVSKYIILVNTVGAVVGAKSLNFYFIDVKQVLRPSKWRRDRDTMIKYQKPHIYI